MMEVWSMSDVGLVRKENQDDYAVAQLPESGYTLCVVCDGMGGPAGGGRPATSQWTPSCRK